MSDNKDPNEKQVKELQAEIEAAITAMKETQEKIVKLFEKLEKGEDK